MRSSDVSTTLNASPALYQLHHYKARCFTSELNSRADGRNAEHFLTCWVTVSSQKFFDVV